MKSFERESGRCTESNANKQEMTGYCIIVLTLVTSHMFDRAIDNHGDNRYLDVHV